MSFEGIHPTTVQIVLRLTSLFLRLGDVIAQLHTLAGRLAIGHRVAPEQGDGGLVRVTAPCRLKFTGGRVVAVGADGRLLDEKPQRDPVLIKALRVAHSFLAEVGDAPLAAPDQAVLRSAPASPYDRKLLMLALLAPDLQAQILEGWQPPGLTLRGLIAADLPAAWEDQRRLFADLA